MSQKTEKLGLTRRRFIQFSAGASALSVIGVSLGCSANTLEKENGNSAAVSPTGQATIPTVCLGCAAHNKCVLQGTVSDGVLVKMEGNPNHPANQGRNCAKSNASIMQAYNPYRVKRPVKRTNPEKGPGVDPKWVEISWDEALQTITEKLKEVKEKDVRRFVWLTGHGGAMDADATSAFAAAVGTKNVIAGGTSTACGGGSSPFNKWVNGNGHGRADMMYCKYFLNLGGNSQVGAKGNAEEILAYMKGKEQGLKVVNVAPHISPSQATADEWIPIKPGTHTQFLMAIVYVLLHELKTFDVEFVKTQTNGAYLIGGDGQYIRDTASTTEDPIRGGNLGKPLVWDAQEQKAKVYDDPTLKDVALEGSFTVDGHPVQPAFQKLRDHVKGFTPEAAEKVSDIPAETIRKVAKEMLDNARIGETITIDGVTMPYRPVAVMAEQGAKCHVDNFQVLMASKILCEVLGAVNVPGSMKSGHAGTLTANPADGVTKAEVKYKPLKKPEGIALKELNPFGGTSGLAFLAMNDPKAYGLDYEVDVLGFWGGNPQLLGADADYVTELYAKIPFIFAISYTFDEPTEQADIVLPESSWLERYGLVDFQPHTSYMESFKKLGVKGTALRQPVVEPLYESKPGNQIVLDLAEKLGVLTGEKGIIAQLNDGLGLKDEYALDINKKYTWDEIMDFRCKKATKGKHDLKWFKENGTFYAESYPVSDYYAGIKYSKVRVPIYFEEFAGYKIRMAKELKETGIVRKPSNEFVLRYLSPLPVWYPHPEHLAPEEFDLYGINYKNMQYHYGNNDNAWTTELTEMQDPYTLYIWMHADTADKKGLKDGDQVNVESFTGGKVEGKVKTSQCIRPDTLAIGAALGHRSVNIFPGATLGPNFNILNKWGEEFMDPINMNIDRDTKVKVTKA